MSSHSHSHDHHHHRATPTNTSSAFLIGIGLNLIFVLVEFFAGWYYNSLALFSDAGHNLTDVASLAISLLALYLAKKASTSQLSYGYRKWTILASLVNAVLLCITVGFIAWESIFRLFHPIQGVSGWAIIVVASIGIFINLGSALMFHSKKDSDINVKWAYLHLLSDAAVSAGAVIVGIALLYGWPVWLDTVVGLWIGGMILSSTWWLLKESTILILDGAPSNLDITQIKQAIESIDGVQSIHHIHVWAMSSTENAFSGHISVDAAAQKKSIYKIKEQVRHELEHFGIQHVTLELEESNEDCMSQNCDH